MSQNDTEKNVSTWPSVPPTSMREIETACMFLEKAVGTLADSEGYRSSQAKLKLFEEVGLHLMAIAEKMSAYDNFYDLDVPCISRYR
jgi:hypothetical protein